MIIDTSQEARSQEQRDGTVAKVRIVALRVRNSRSVSPSDL